MTTLHPCLWFDHEAAEAVQFYTSLLPGSKIVSRQGYPDSAAKQSGRPAGSEMSVVFELAGQKFMALNGGPHFKHTPAWSIFVWCKDAKEIERIWQKLAEGGAPRMELGEYPWAAKYGWTVDRFGVEWQLMLSDKYEVAPSFLFVDAAFGSGSKAMEFYSSLFENSRTEFIARDEKTNTITHATFFLAGRKFAMMEGQGQHGYTFSPAFSIVAECETQAEIDRLWKSLSSVPAAEQCGWLVDQFGVSWQIVPANFNELLQDPKRADRVMAALLKMKKLDIKTLREA